MLTKNIGNVLNSEFSILLLLGIILIFRWSEALHGVAASPGVHFGGDVRETLKIVLSYYIISLL